MNKSLCAVAAALTVLASAIPVFACHPCEIADKIKSIEKRAATAEAAGDQNKADNLKGQACTKYANALIKLEDAEVAVLNAKLGHPPAGCVELTSGGKLAPPRWTKSGARGAAGGGSTEAGGAPCPIKIHIVGNVAGTNCDYRVEITPNPSNHPGFTIASTSLVVNVVGRQKKEVSVNVSASNSVPAGTKATYRVRAFNAKTDAEVHVATEHVEVMAASPGGTGPLDAVKVTRNTPLVTSSNGGFVELEWKFLELTGSGQTLKLEVGPILDPLSKDTYLDDGTNNPPKYPVPDFFPIKPTPTGTPMAGANPDSFTIDVAVPAGGETTVSVGFSGSDFCAPGMLGCCTARVRNPLVPTESLDVPQYIYNDTPVLADPQAESVVMLGRAAGFGTAELLVFSNLFTCDIFPGMIPEQIFDELARKVNDHPGRLSDTGFPTTALFDYNKLSFQNAEPGDVLWNTGALPPGLLPIVPNSFVDLSLQGMVCHYLGGSLMGFDVTVHIDPGAAPIPGPVALQLEFDGVQLISDFPINATGTFGPTTETHRIVTPVLSTKPGVTATIDPHHIHSESGGDSSNNVLQSECPIFDPSLQPDVSDPFVVEIPVSGIPDFPLLVQRATNLLGIFTNFVETSIGPTGDVVVFDGDLLDTAFYKAVFPTPLVTYDHFLLPGQPINVFQPVFFGDTNEMQQVENYQLTLFDPLPPFLQYQYVGFARIPPIDLVHHQFMIFLPINPGDFHVLPFPGMLDPLGPGAVPIPPTPSMAGLEFHLQAVVLDPFQTPPIGGP